MAEVDTKELQEFIREAISQIKEGAKGHIISKPVEFEVAVAKTTTAEGKMGIKVLGIGGVDGGGSITTESTSKMKFEISIREDDDYVGGVTSMGSGSDLLDTYDQ